jgi:hypothetical protein
MLLCGCGGVLVAGLTVTTAFSCVFLQRRCVWLHLLQLLGFVFRGALLGHGPGAQQWWGLHLLSFSLCCWISQCAAFGTVAT